MKGVMFIMTRQSYDAMTGSWSFLWTFAPAAQGLLLVNHCNSYQEITENKVCAIITQQVTLYSNESSLNSKDQKTLDIRNKRPTPWSIMNDTVNLKLMYVFE